jgi:hypothetical protein
LDPEEGEDAIMITRNGMIGLSVACLLAVALLAAAPKPAAAGDRALVVNPAIYRTAEDGTSGPSVQLVRRYYYGYGPGWGYGYARPYYAPYVYAPPPVVSYGYSYPAYSYSYPAYGYGYGYPAYGYGPGGGVGFYGPRVGVGVGVW